MENIGNENKLKCEICDDGYFLQFINSETINCEICH